MMRMGREIGLMMEGLIRFKNRDSKKMMRMRMLRMTKD